MIISSQLTMREYYGNWKILQIRVFFSPTLEKLIVKHAPVCYQPWLFLLRVWIGVLWALSCFFLLSSHSHVLTCLSISSVPQHRGLQISWNLKTHLLNCLFNIYTWEVHNQLKLNLSKIKHWFSIIVYSSYSLFLFQQHPLLISRYVPSESGRNYWSSLSLPHIVG